MDAGISVGLTPSGNRKFGFTVGPAFLVVGGVLLWRDHTLAAYVAAAVGGMLMVIASIAPMLLGPVNRGWMRFGLLLSTITTPIVMALMYFVVFTPIGVLRRAFGANALVRPPGDSYWVARPEDKRRSNLTRQF